MNITNYFIKHPVISIILNSMIMIIGLLCLNNITLREYPKIDFPVLTISSYYPNASAELVELSVTNPLEDQLAGTEGLETMTSESHYGASYIKLNFTEDTPIDRALSATRDAIELAKAQLPKEVLEPTVQRKSKSTGLPFMAITVTANDLSFGEIVHYANLYLKNAFRSLPGVAMAEIWGPPFTMAVTLDPKKMFAFGINADDVYFALEKRNLSMPVGKFKTITPTTLDLHLAKVSDFEDIVIKNSNENNENPIFLKSIADIGLKSDDQKFRIHINGKPGILIDIEKAEDANPLDVANAVRKQIATLKANSTIPLDIELTLDQSKFITASLKNIRSSIIEAILLVLIVVFLFLRDARATIIPLITIPISLLGSAILLKIFGFSINTITLLAMVLAVGLVVDDAIVILENIKRHIEQGCTPLNAAIKGSSEIGFAIIAMTFTLSAVYAPIVFIKGTVGKLFIEFAVALAGSVIISGIVALTLSPLMCSKILITEQPNQNVSFLDFMWKKLENLYTNNLAKIFEYPKYTAAIAICLCLITIGFFKLLPTEMTPKEDRGLIGAYIPPIPGQDINSMEKYATLVEELLRANNIPEAENYLTFISDGGANIAVPFKNHADRNRSTTKVLASIQNKLSSIPSIDVHGWSIDSGLPGTDHSTSSSNLQLAISTIGDYRSLLTAINELRKNIEEKNQFVEVYHDLDLDSPGYKINLDQNIMARLNISPLTAAKTIEVFFSGQHSLFFEKDSLKYPITIQGNISPWTLNELYVTNAKNNRISLGTIANMEPTAIPSHLNHYNQMRTATLVAKIKPGQNLDSAMNTLLSTAKNTLPKNLKLEWQGWAKMYHESSNTTWLLFGMALVFIYAILAMQFENFSDPIIIMLTVPLASFGAIFLTWLCGQSINIYTQIGLITLIGLITKHGILIVEFANQLTNSKPLQIAIQSAAIIRLRPILMTTSAMILGALPLIISSGAGFEARRAIGIVLIGGLLFGTVFTLFILPQFYYLAKSALLRK
ncbi:MAG: efflux RND transporter permease subunit [Gammaproteobacteria bacterium]